MIALDLIIALGPYKFDMHTTVECDGTSINCGHYIISVNCRGKFYCNNKTVTECDMCNAPISTIYIYSNAWMDVGVIFTKPWSGFICHGIALFCDVRTSYTILVAHFVLIRILNGPLTVTWRDSWFDSQMVWTENYYMNGISFALKQNDMRTKLLIPWRHRCLIIEYRSYKNDSFYLDIRNPLWWKLCT